MGGGDAVDAACVAPADQVEEHGDQAVEAGEVEEVRHVADPVVVVVGCEGLVAEDCA